MMSLNFISIYFSSPNADMRISGELWEYFYRGEKQNKSHYKAYCIKYHAPNYVKSQSNLDLTNLNGENWFTPGMYSANDRIATW